MLKAIIKFLKRKPAKYNVLYHYTDKDNNPQIIKRGPFPDWIAIGLVSTDPHTRTMELIQ